MGASKEKKRRLEEKNAGVETKWDVREKENAEEKKKKKRNYIIGGVVAVFTVLILFFSSNFFYRTFAAVKIGDVGYSAPEYKYFYYDTYSSYYNMYYSYYGEYASYFMPDEETLKSATLENMQQITMLCDEANAAGFTLSDEVLAEIDKNMASVEEYAKNNNFTGVNNYLAANYGKGMNKELYRELLEKSYLAANYYSEVYNSYEYTDDELAAYYNEHENEYDKITYYVKFFDGAAVEDDPETTEDETVTQEEAMAEAKAEAEAYYADDPYAVFADSGEPTTSAGGDISSDYASWLTSKERSEGDVTLVETESGYYVVCFVARDDNDYDMVNVRHILIKPEEVDESAYENDDDYNAALEAADAAAKEKAQEIYDEWLAGDATEETFAAAADEYSDDSPEGGLYENVYKGQMVEEFEEWCFEPHEYGDTEIIETTYGYHIMYYVGLGDNYRLYTAENSMRSEDYNAWLEEKLATGYEVQETFLFRFAD